MLTSPSVHVALAPVLHFLLAIRRRRQGFLVLVEWAARVTEEAIWGRPNA
jgi:hypothetical protein